MPDVIMLNYDETATTKVPDDVRAAVEAAKKQIVGGQDRHPRGRVVRRLRRPADGAFKMGLLSPAASNDQGWNTMAYNALKRVEKDLGAEVSYVELKQDPASYEKAFRDFAAQGYQLILGHGNEFEDAAKAAAKDYPNVQFFISSSRLKRADGHRPEHELRRAALPDGRHRRRRCARQRASSAAWKSRPSRRR